MKKKLLALICALALVFSLVGCTISAPDAVGSIGDFEGTSSFIFSPQQTSGTPALWMVVTRLPQ